MNKYFDVNEVFIPLINKVFKDSELEIEDIPVGWTNIVKKIISKGDVYIGRFPRDDFWADVLVHEYKVSNYISGAGLKISKLNLYHDNNQRIFTIHKAIPGISLDEKKDSFNNNDWITLAEEIANFLTQLHSVDFSNLDFPLEKIEIFLNRMCKYHDIDLFIPTEEENSNVLIHGDFNIKNIILDEKNGLAGVIDLGFASVGYVEWDFARICRDCPIEFENHLINFYEKKSNRRIDVKRFNYLKNMWKKICDKYIEYMNNSMVKS